MVSLLHANAKTTPRIREEIQNSKESIAALAKKYNINPKTVMKWKHADGVDDKRSGAKQPRSSLSLLEQQVVCEFRRVTKLPLDDVFLALKEKIPTLTRSNLHRCLTRNGLNRLPKDEAPAREKKKFKDYPLGFVHIDITEVRIEKQKLYLFVAIDRFSKYVYVELHSSMTQAIACAFLKNLIDNCPFKINKILTDNGAQFTYELLAEHLRPKHAHAFDEICNKNNIEHRLTKFRHPWSEGVRKTVQWTVFSPNGQVEVTNRIIKQYTTKTYHYESEQELKYHLMAFILFYNHQRPLKALKFKTPYAILIEEYERCPDLFKDNPSLKLKGLNK